MEKILRYRERERERKNTDCCDKKKGWATIIPESLLRLDLAEIMVL